MVKTQENLVRLLKRVLTQNQEITWNSVDRDFAADLGRALEQGDLSNEELLQKLDAQYTYRLTREMKKEIEKELR